MSGLLEGTTLAGQYFLRKKIGSGGVADVYDAFDQNRTARVAVKVLRNDKEITPERITAFRKDAAWLEEFKHPNIVRVYELVIQDNFIFMVMEYINGRDLRKEIDHRRAPFLPDQLPPIFQPVCSALHFTHGARVFHCDIKPANILLANTGEVYLTDFGVARLASEQRGGGTPPYMAPEQIREQPVDARTDVYALGVTLYEMLSGGTLPFRGDSRESQTKGNTARERVEWEHCNLPIPPLHHFSPDVPHQVAAVVFQALNKDPVYRYPDVMDLLRALEHASAVARNPILPVPKDFHTTAEATQPHRPASPEPVKKLVRPSQPTLAGPSLICYSGKWPGRTIAIDQPRFIIGRFKECHLVLPDPNVSRRHAVLIKGKRGVYIQDEGSKAGTFVNGQKITSPVLLKPGDRITIGFAWVFEFRP